MSTPWERETRAGRAEMLRVGREAERGIAHAYHAARVRLTPALDGFTARYRAALDASDGAPVALRWAEALDGGHWPLVAAQVRLVVGAFASTAHDLTTQAQQQATTVGGEQAQAAMTAALRPIAPLLPPYRFQRATEQAVRQFVARAKDGGPLARLFAGFGPDEAVALHDTLASGLAAGTAPGRLARELADTLDRLSYGRAVTICRTETIHAWNGAALEQYRANRDVVSQWMWIADQGANTCAACLAMDGTLHDLDEDLDDHVNGRCTRAPVTRSYADILGDAGIDTSDLELDPAPWETYQRGSDWLDAQDAATQRAVFGGDAPYRAWKAGDATLDDYAAIRRDPTWGDSIQQASLKSLGLDASDYSEE